MSRKPIDRAVAAVGGLNKLAEKLEVDPQVIVNWRKRGVPAKRVLAVEAATKDKNGRPAVLRHDLRPDLYPEDIAA